MNPAPVRAVPVAATGYLAPRQVLAGPGASRDCGAALRTWAVPPGPVIVIADRVVAEAGLLEPTLDGLHSAGFTAHVFSDIAGEPDDQVTARAVAWARSYGAISVVGVGGGSAMDVAKVVALLLTNPGEVADWLGVITPAEPVAPLALVPTTTGTGAEATRIAMITVTGAKKVVSCIQFVPLIAVLDDDLVAGLPAGVVAATGMDALAHAVESILSTNRNQFTLAAATRAIAVLIADLEPAVAGDPAARSRVLYASHLGGLALNAGVVIGHSLAYVIARRAPMPHGTSCALALPFCLAYSHAVGDGVAVHLARTLTGDAHDDLRTAAEHVQALSHRLGQPRSLADVGVVPAQLAAMADDTITDYPRPNSPVAFQRDSVTTLLEHLHRGDLAAAWAAT